MILVPVGSDDDVNPGLPVRICCVRDDLLDDFFHLAWARTDAVHSAIYQDAAWLITVGKEQEKRVAKADVVHPNSDGLVGHTSDAKSEVTRSCAFATSANEGRDRHLHTMHVAGRSGRSPLRNRTVVPFGVLLPDV